MSRGAVTPLPSQQLAHRHGQQWRLEDLKPDCELQSLGSQSVHCASLPRPQGRGCLHGVCQAGPRAPKASPGQDLRGGAGKQAEQRCEYRLTNCATRGISEARASPWLWRKLVKLQRTSVILSHLIPSALLYASYWLKKQVWRKRKPCPEVK